MRPTHNAPRRILSTDQTPTSAPDGHDRSPPFDPFDGAPEWYRLWVENGCRHTPESIAAWEDAPDAASL